MNIDVLPLFCLRLAIFGGLFLKALEGPGEGWSQLVTDIIASIAVVDREFLEDLLPVLIALLREFHLDRRDVLSLIFILTIPQECIRSLLRLILERNQEILFFFLIHF